MKTRIEQLTAENLHHVAIMHLKVYGKKLELNTLRNKYQLFEPHTRYYGVMAFEGELAVGFMGIVPTLIEYQDKKEWWGFLVNGMTLSTHRSWVLFFNLLRSLHDLLSSEGIQCIWTNSPPQTALLYTPRGGWTAHHQLTAYKIPIMERKLAFARRKIRGVFNLDLKGVLGDHLIPASSFHSFANTDSVRVCRNEPFMKYKTSSGSVFAKYNDCQLWLKHIGALCIGDLKVHSEKELKHLMDWLVPIAKRIGAPEIIFQTSPGSMLDQYFGHHYKGFQTWTLGNKGFSSAFPLEKFCVTWGDLDTF